MGVANRQRLPSAFYLPLCILPHTLPRSGRLFNRYAAAVILRRDAFDFFKHLAEIFDVVDPDHLGDLRNFQVRVEHQQFGFVDPVFPEIVGEIVPELLFELAGNILSADVKMTRDVLKRQIRLIMVLDILDDFRHRFVFGRLMGR